jgi:acetyl coenzyme A synthetase (ADP forming)-like protein
MIQKIYNPLNGKMKVFGYVSGSGATLWKCYEMQKELDQSFEGTPFEVVGLFCSKKDAKAVAKAAELGIPCEVLDIKEYYASQGAPLGDLNVRASYDREALKLIKKYQPDVILLAGYVWAMTDVILDNFTVVNVHPADLSNVVEGHRVYAGPNGVGDALVAKEPYIASSCHLATKELDNGPILMISEKVQVDYSKLETLSEAEFVKFYLKLVNEQSRLVGAMTLYEIAQGNFAINHSGSIYYKGECTENGKEIESFSENIPLYKRNLEAMTNPRSVVVVGASSKGGIGSAVVNNIIKGGYLGRLYVVNKGADSVLGIQGFSSIEDIHDEIDVVIITVPSAYVLDIAEACGKKGVKSIICISAGFKEIGTEGAKLEKALVNTVNRYNMRLLGPNCMGILNTDDSARFNATILHHVPNRGGIGFITQSGAMGAAMLDFQESLGLGFSMVASLGNQADVSVNDLLQVMAEDEQTKVILLYLESIPEPERFMRIAKKIVMKKPIVLIKSGRTGSGAKAASSHTGSLAGNDRIINEIIRSCNIIRVTHLEEAFSLASVLSKTRMLDGRRIAVVTNAGGPGIQVTDRLIDLGFELPGLKEPYRSQLKEVLLKEASVENPIDLVAPAPPEHYATALKIVEESGQYDAAIVVCVPPATVDTGKVAEKISVVIKDMKIPVITSFFGPTLGEPARKVLSDKDIASLYYPEQTAEVFGHMLKEVISQDSTTTKVKADTKDLAQEIYKVQDAYLSNEIAQTLLSRYGFELAKSRLVKNLEELEQLQWSFPVVAKIDHIDVVHKSDEGGVVLDINDEVRLKAVVSGLLNKFDGARGVWIQEQIEPGLEIILGAIYDPQAGHCMMVGMGGIMVEVFKDVVFIMVPSGRKYIESKIKSLKSYPIIEGTRGSKGVDLELLIDNIEKLNQLILDYPEIVEMDLNPLIYSEKRGCFVVVDQRIKF